MMQSQSGEPRAERPNGPLTWPARRRTPRFALGAAIASLLLALVLAAGGPPLASFPAGAQVVKTATATVPARGASGRAAAAGPGAVLGWGDNTNGQLGNGTNLNASTAVQVQGLTGVVALAPGSSANHALALRRDGSLAAWGYGGDGELGIGAVGDWNVPVPVFNLPAGDPVVAVAVGGTHSLALLQSGAVYAWGFNSRGQLGIGSTTPFSVPVQVKDTAGTGTLSGIVAIAAGGEHSLAVDGSGKVYGWGRDDNGQVGNGPVASSWLTPQPVAGVGGSGLLNLGACSAPGANCQVAGGLFHSLARAANGNVFAWGANTVGQLGTNGSPATLSPTPVLVLPVSGTGQLVASSIAAGGQHNLALLNDGSVAAWGFGLEGEVGDGSQSNQSQPVAVKLEAGNAPLTGITAVAAGNKHSLALTTGGTVFAWGGGEFGRLGDGTFNGHNRAAPVLNVSGITAIAAGNEHSLALGPDFPLATVTPQPTATPASTATPQPTATPYIYTPPPASADRFPLAPVRILDTRASDPPGILHVGFDENGNPTPTSPIQPGVVRRFLVAGKTFAGTTIPATARAVDLNVTALPTAGFGGFLTIYPGHIPDVQRPLSSVLNPVLAVNNNFYLTTLAPAGGPNAGTFAAYTQAVPLDLVIDVVGYYQ